MSVELAATCGILAALVGVVDTVPYIRDIVQGRTRPHRGTWLIWAVLAVVVSISQYSDGARWSLVMAGAQAILTCLILVIAIRYGEGGVSRWDVALVALAGVGVAGWVLAEEPVVATLFVVAADLVAAAMMVPKTYRDPESETLVMFALASVGGVLAVGAVGVLEPSLLVYPVYYALVNGGIALLIVVRRNALAVAAAPRGMTAQA